MGLFAENYAARGAIFDFRKHMGSPLCRKNETSHRVEAVVVIERGVGCDEHLAPIVEPGSFEISVLERETKRLDQMEFCTDGGAGSDDIARILRYFGLDQYDMEIETHLFP